ncbi:hypothetical protein OIE14_12585 [Micromonospora peucetia]|uniref:Uncharacterized protein n=1 Tax=Micromonospora peucetia TaxID=47871 RepID=A0A1C6UTT2_9ACTN|nr:hypothetical protein [Micromonospora peucetia]WSA34812.1 hypothetical protein OIE14_12585 [Micromonospora peucetia]SCL57436.1 hypothetical protein GA0070608_1822 [Micromonospora peucetia]
MTTGKKPAPGKPNATDQRKGVVIFSIITVVVVAGCVGAALIRDDDSSTVVPPPTTTERADTVSILARAAESQGICYGWQLKDRFARVEVVNVGSNLGDGVSVEDNPACPRWVRVTGSINYTPQSSESNDTAYITVGGSDDFTRADLRAVERGLERFGLDEDAFIDEPGWAVTRAAVSLPLLLAETGAVSPAPMATAAPAATPAALPDAGSDLWRDRWGYLLAVAGLLLLTALLVAVGVWQRRRQLRQEAEREQQAAARRDQLLAPAQRTRKPRRTPEGR